MVLLKIVPIDGGEYTHTYMHVKNRKPNILYRLKNNGPHSPPSLSLSLSQRQSAWNPGQLTWAEQNATFSLGLPLTAPVDPGMERMLTGQGRGAGHPCIQGVRADPGASSQLLWPARLVPLWKSLAVLFPQSSKSPPAEVPPAHSVPRRLQGMIS